MAGFHTTTSFKFDDYTTPKTAWENIKQYIPQNKLSDKDYNETTKKKQDDTKKNIQYSMQPKKIVKMIKNIDY